MRWFSYGATTKRAAIQNALWQLEMPKTKRACSAIGNKIFCTGIFSISGQMSQTSQKCSNILQHYRSQALVCIVKYFWAWHLPNPHIWGMRPMRVRTMTITGDSSWYFTFISFPTIFEATPLVALYLYWYKIFYLRLPNRPKMDEKNGNTSKMDTPTIFEKMMFFSLFPSHFCPHFLSHFSERLK